MQTLGTQRVNVRETDTEQVVTIKIKIASLIDELEKERGDKNTNPASGNKQRIISIAQTKLEEACMFAVKAICTE